MSPLNPGRPLAQFAGQQTKTQTQHRDGSGQGQRTAKSRPPRGGDARPRWQSLNRRPRPRQLRLEKAMEQSIEFVAGLPRFSRINGRLQHRTHDFVSIHCHLPAALAPRLNVGVSHARRLETLRQTLAGPAEAHVYGCCVDAQEFGDLLRRIFQGILICQNLSV